MNPAAMTSPDERVLTVAPRLSRWVSEVRTMTVPASSPTPLTRLPSGATCLVVCVAEGKEAAILAVGPNSRASYKVARDVPLYTRFVFRPGAARAALGVDVSELAERAVPLDELWGQPVARLREEIATAAGRAGSMVHAVERVLLERVAARERNPSGLAQRAADELDLEREEPEHLGALARRLGVGERRLRQVFQEEIGISPKRYTRIVRIRRAVARAGTGSWAELAAELGFADQAHLNAEFRSLLGVSPRRFLAGQTSPAQGPCGS